jgi:hypothetical protein
LGIPDGLWPFFVRHKADGSPTLVTDPLTYQLCDWGFEPSGQEATSGPGL